MTIEKGEEHLCKFNLVTEEKNTIWKIVVSDYELINDDGSVKKKVEGIAELVVDTNNDLWDIIIYKDMVAFKLAMERKTYIYSKEYWKSRCDTDFNSLKVLKIE